MQYNANRTDSRTSLLNAVNLFNGNCGSTILYKGIFRRRAKRIIGLKILVRIITIVESLFGCINFHNPSIIIFIRCIYLNQITLNNHLLNVQANASVM